MACLPWLAVHCLLTIVTGVWALDLPSKLFPFIIAHLPLGSLQREVVLRGQGRGLLRPQLLLRILNMGQATGKVGIWARPQGKWGMAQQLPKAQLPEVGSSLERDEEGSL